MLLARAPTSLCLRHGRANDILRMLVGSSPARFMSSGRPNNDNTSQYRSPIRYLSTNLNEDNMSQYHVESKSNEHIPPQEWTTFHGKIPVLQTDPAVASAEKKALLADLEQPRVSVLMELTDRVGVLHDVLKYFWKYDISITRIESRPVQINQWDGKKRFDFFMDFNGSLEDAAVHKVLHDLGPLTDKLLVLDEKDVHWFPHHISDLDMIAHRTLDAGVDLESDHPGFNDNVYRSRRAELATNANKHRWDQPIPCIDYTPEETATWGAVWDRMEDLWEQYACKEYLVRTFWVLF